MLVVEDNADIREILVEYLSMEGFAVHGAADGAEAFAVLRSANIDVLLLDLNLPDISGEEIARRVRSDLRLAAKPIIAIAARRPTHTDLFDAHFMKPPDMGSVVARIVGLGSRSRR